MTSRTRKDLIWHLLIEKDYDHRYVFDYLLDHDHYFKTNLLLGYDYLSDWEKEDYKSILDEMWNRNGGCAAHNALVQEGIE